MKKKLLAVALLSTFIAAPAMAGDAGAYIGLDYSMLTLGNLAAGSTVTQPSGGFRIDGGYNFDKNWGAEIGYFMNGNATTGAGANNTITPNTTYVAGVGTYPVNDMFDVFGKLGVAMNQLTGSATTGCTVCGVQTGLMYGVGADYNINKQVGVRLQYENLGNMEGAPAGGSAITGSNIALGVIYKF